MTIKRNKVPGIYLPLECIDEEPLRAENAVESEGLSKTENFTREKLNQREEDIAFSRAFNNLSLLSRRTDWRY